MRGQRKCASLIQGPTGEVKSRGGASGEAEDFMRGTHHEDGLPSPCAVGPSRSGGSQYGECRRAAMRGINHRSHVRELVLERVHRFSSQTTAMHRDVQRKSCGRFRTTRRLPRVTLSTHVGSVVGWTRTWEERNQGSTSRVGPETCLLGFPRAGRWRLTIDSILRGVRR